MTDISKTDTQSDTSKESQSGKTGHHLSSFQSGTIQMTRNQCNSHFNILSVRGTNVLESFMF